LVLLLLLLLWCLLLLLLAWCSICSWQLKVALEVELAPVAACCGSNCAVFCLKRAAAQTAAPHQVSKNSSILTHPRKWQQAHISPH
jgi:hypothetical protein